MTTYAYKAMDTTGRRLSGSMEASNLADLEARLARLNLDFIVGKPLVQRPLFSGRVPQRELIALFFHLEQLVGAGVPVAEALADLRDSTVHPRLRDVLVAMTESIDAGRTLSQAMDDHPAVFDRVSVGVVRAGEATGDLHPVLAERVEALKWRDELGAQTQRLLIYPAFLGTVALGLVGFMLIHLVPRLADFLKTTGHTLPPHTEVLLALGTVLAAHGAWLATLLAAAVLAGTALLRHSAVARARLDRLVLRLPLVGPTLRKMRLARFAATFASLHAAGIPILDAIATAADAAADTELAAALERARLDVAAGLTLAAAFAATGLFPPLAIRMLRVGETTGRLDAALRNVAYFYSRDVRETAEHTQALIEPVLTVLIGLVMGWIMLAVLDPIYDLIGRLKT